MNKKFKYEKFQNYLFFNVNQRFEIYYTIKCQNKYLYSSHITSYKKKEKKICADEMTKVFGEKHD